MCRAYCGCPEALARRNSRRASFLMPSVSLPVEGSRLPVLWRSGTGHWLAVALATALTLLAFHDAIRFTVAIWGAVEEYSYGWFIPVISAFLIWQRSDRLREHALQGSWSGLWIVAAALFMLILGELSAIRLIAQYGIVVAAVGLAVCAIGWRGARLIAMPLGILLFMIPLPQFFMRELSQQLQLVSSQIGVFLIRLFDISVHLEGNVIDLGSMKLQVVEACNGLRYLFPLMVLGFLCAYFYQDAMWKRVLIVVITVPLTIVINSLRIGLIGVTVEHWGRGMAEGLLHDLEGGFMFAVCMVLLFGIMALLARIGPRPRSLRMVFGLEFPDPPPAGVLRQERALPWPAVVAGGAMAAAAAFSAWGPDRSPIIPERTAFNQFPLDLPGGWVGRLDYIEPEVLAVLAVDDHFIANYRRVGGEAVPSVNFYVAWYDTQSGGQSSHSPRTCIPGGGWAMDEMRTVSVGIPGAALASAAPPTTTDGLAQPIASPLQQPALLEVNRAVISRGEQRQLVYYWFQQRGRNLTDEFEVKWHILADGVTRRRSDGALLRLVTPIDTGAVGGEAQAEARLAAFLAQVHPRLPAFVPD